MGRYRISEKKEADPLMRTQGRHLRIGIRICQCVFSLDRIAQSRIQRLDFFLLKKEEKLRHRR